MFFVFIHSRMYFCKHFLYDVIKKEIRIVCLCTRNVKEGKSQFISKFFGIIDAPSLFAKSFLIIWEAASSVDNARDNVIFTRVGYMYDGYVCGIYVVVSSEVFVVNQILSANLLPSIVCYGNSLLKKSNNRRKNALSIKILYNDRSQKDFEIHISSKISKSHIWTLVTKILLIFLCFIFLTKTSCWNYHGNPLHKKSCISTCKLVVMIAIRKRF